MSQDRHRNDIYGDLAVKEGVNPPIPAATVCVLRESASGGIETLMLRKNSKIAFGGMWVFPGGRIDPEDYPPDGNLERAARAAAAREAKEETDLKVEPDKLVQISHWTPPPSTPRRYATWFFAWALQNNDAITVDGGEIREHVWVTASDALAQHQRGEIDLAPPTWITLHELSRQTQVSDLLSKLEARAPKVYETRVAVDSDGTRVALWFPDAGYETASVDVPGARHRLVLAKTGFEFIESA